MKLRFADTSFYIATLSADDAHHSAACALLDESPMRIVTHGGIIVELGNYFSASPLRPVFIKFVRKLRGDPNTLIEPVSERLLNRGIDLFEKRLDKNWSLSDCISFVVMTDKKLTDALTADHHFEQAGFRALLRTP